jgi:glutaminyl-tRNA synthetase
MKSAVNSKELLQDKIAKFGEGVLTRFPPEPNGYLHIGHSKAMRFNFMQAKMSKGGKCYLRFDDTNPTKENIEYIENIKENIKFMGYEPWKITHASDNFDILYNYAVQLIKQGDAFVCSETAEEMRKKRGEGLPSKDRDRSVEENLRIFNEMRLGLHEEGAYSLRAKIDYKNVNTTLRDPVIYRIKFHSHPHVGDKWCIYPLYDYTHPICDSLEGITHSLCSLEFEIRRELYYWVLERLNIYRPHVWEYSRLNITYTVLSKRKLHELIFTNRVAGWDDPRILTINGMRRRGYPAEAINNFCDVIGVTRRGNENYINFGVLEN